MKQHYSLEVARPCSENYNDFSQTKKGGFCESCQKEVIDFTKLTDDEILQFFLDSKSRTCGRFRKDQLKVYPPNNINPARLRGNFIRTGLISIALFSLMPSIKATPFVPFIKSEIISNTIMCQDELKSDDGKVKDKHRVNGIVMDEDGEPLIGVSVTIKGTAKGTVTDFDGKFQFNDLLNTGDILVFSYIGLETVEYKIIDSSPINISIKMELSCVFLTGEVAFEEGHSAKKSLWQKIKAIFK